MADGRVDLVVVYKIDRLTRSLADFAKLVERFDAAGASFVSVTQAFNTATSMGRLTLNVLLSFAQFEREVTVERIRDKIAASNKKGLWMGGQVPLGYDAQDRGRVVNAAEAETVRIIFDLYLRRRTIPALKTEVDRRGLRTKARVRSDGSITPASPFTRGRLHHLLTNPIYVGRIRHGGAVYAGEHEAIVDERTWNDVQTALTEKAAKPRRAHGRADPAPLAGKLVDESGDRLTLTHTNKRGRRCRYDVSNRLISSGEAEGWRLSAVTRERAAANALAAHITQPVFRAALQTTEAADGVKSVAKRLRSAAYADLLAKLVAAGEVTPEALTLEINGAALAEALSLKADIAPSLRTVTAPWSIKRRGVETKLILDRERRPRDAVLVKTIALGQAYLDALKSGRSVSDIARGHDVTPGWITRHIDVALLAPKLVDRILDGEQPPGLTAACLLQTPPPSRWNAQKTRLGFAN